MTAINTIIDSRSRSCNAGFFIFNRYMLSHIKHFRNIYVSLALRNEFGGTLGSSNSPKQLYFPKDNYKQKQRDTLP